MSIRVMSFNIRCASAPDGEQGWRHRRRLVIERIRAFGPDLLGLQECRDDEQAAFVRASLPDYAFVGVRRGGEGDSAVEMAPLLYRRDAFDLLDSGHFWLGPEPDLPGRLAWGAAYPRTASWARLRLRSGAVLAFLNTHFDYQGSAREESARQLAQWAKSQRAGEGLVITGDFNAERDSEAFRALAADGLLRDALAERGVTGGSYQDYGRAPVFEAIDWILVSRHLRVESAGVDAFVQNGLYPSDHFPVTAALGWTGAVSSPSSSPSSRATVR